jgi:magnesium transporter
MLKYLLKNEDGFYVHSGVLEAKTKQKVIWIEVSKPTETESIFLREHFNLDKKAQIGNVAEDNGYLWMKSQLAKLNENGAPEFATVNFVLGDALVVTFCDVEKFHPFDNAISRCLRKPDHAESPKAFLRLLLQVANDGAADTIDNIADALDQSTSEITQISEGYNELGQELGVSDLSGIMRTLNDKEELILNCIEAQLTLARTVRYLSGEVDNRKEADLQALVTELAGDVAGVKEHAGFEHEKVRYLQSAVTNILNIKQNQIVKVFTIITAVFLPPTLVGTFYGMNFAVMPELSWEHGFIYSMFLTLGAALLPLLYIKKRGWLR